MHRGLEAGDEQSISHSKSHDRILGHEHDDYHGMITDDLAMGGSLSQCFIQRGMNHGDQVCTPSCNQLPRRASLGTWKDSGDD